MTREEERLEYLAVSIWKYGHIKDRFAKLYGVYKTLEAVDGYASERVYDFLLLADMAITFEYMEGCANV
jgi:hypothetical protein